MMSEGAETENTAEGTQEDSIQVLEQEYKEVFNGLKTTYQAFVTDYLKTFDSKISAIAAGYSSKSAVKQGSRLCRSKNIATCIAIQQRINSLRGKITTAWVMEELKINYERCMQATPVRDKQGNETGEYTYNASSANRALELIGQQLGMFGKGDKDIGKGGKHLHVNYVNYPPVPESIQAWVDQMKEVGYEAALPVKEEENGQESDTSITKDVPGVTEGQGRSVTPITSEDEDETRRITLLGDRVLKDTQQGEEG